MSIYVFKLYDPVFPELFEKEKDRLKSFLKKDYLIEHVGSTSVSGLGGKGIIDICLEIPEQDKEEVWKDLEKAGYILRPNLTSDMHVTHTIFLPDPIEGERKYNLHVREPNSPWLKEALAFRDYLRKNPEDVKRYSDIKEKAAIEAKGNRDIYQSIKKSVIDEIYSKAMKDS